jgi:DNA-binding transcriptional regulator PaaX
MDDQDILKQVSALVEQEHELRSGTISPQTRIALERLEEQLDQCWDLLRQRQARREFGDAPEQAQVRPAGEVEGYLQ